jgi:predicted HicB family RNase H-like nuclease
MRNDKPKMPAVSSTGRSAAALARPGGSRDDHFTYRVTWSAEDDEHVGLCVEFPSLSWLAKTPESALKGIRNLVAEVIADMLARGESVPVPMAERIYSGEFRVRIPPDVHRALAMQAAEQGVSLNRLASAKLATA